MDDDPKEPGAQGVINRAIDFLRLCEEVDSENRVEALDDMRFREGGLNQWPAEAVASRQTPGQERPILTVNKTDAFITQVENQQRQQRPRIKVSPTGGRATKKLGDVVQGVIRHVENNRGGGDWSYDTSFGHASTSGKGYIRVMSERVRWDKLEQDLYLMPVENPLSVYFDPSSVWPDGSDGTACLITTMVKKEEFKRLYPGKDFGANFDQHGTGDSYRNWLSKDEIRVAEFYCINRIKDALVQLSDGTVFVASNPPPVQIPADIREVQRIDTYRPEQRYWKLSALDILEGGEEGTLIPGQYLDVIPVYGRSSNINGKRKTKGLVRNAKDPARMFNFWRTAATETMALTPKAKWVMAEGQDEGHEREFATANTSAFPSIKYKPVEFMGQMLPPPLRVQPEGPPVGFMAMAQSISEDLSAVLGIVDPAVRIGGNVSGKALNAERQQSDNSTFNYFDNLTRSMAQVGRVLVGKFPYYFHEPNRVMRIIGEDGKEQMVTLNQPNPSPGKDTPGPIEEVINDMSVSDWAIVMETGPGYSTKRQEAVSYMAPMFEKSEKLMDVAGDLLFRNMDGPGSELIADRLAAVNPLAQIDEQSEIPPGVQMKLKQQEQMIKQLQQALQAAGMEIQTKEGIEKLRQDGAMRRELVKSHTQIHVEDQENSAWMRDVDMQSATKRHDTEVRAQTALSVAEINALRELLKTRVNNEHDTKILERQAEQAEREVSQASKE